MRLRLPKIGMEMTEATLSEWLVADGSRVEAGAPIYCIETEKVEHEVEAPVAGTLRQLAAAGATYQVGDELGEIVEG